MPTFIISQISLHLSSNKLFIIKKEIYLPSSKPLLYALIFGRIAHKGLTFLQALQPIKYVKTFLPEGTLSVTTYSINV